MEEEKWNKVIKFLRNNPNLLLKLIPSTMAIDEQGFEELQKSGKIKKDQIHVKKPIRIKSAARKKKVLKSNNIV